MGKKISLTLKVNLQVTVMAHLVEKVKKEPMKGVVSSHGKDGVVALL